MKKNLLSGLIVLSLCIISFWVHADVIMPGQHWVDVCNKIINIPNTSNVKIFLEITWWWESTRTEITGNTCLPSFYKFAPRKIIIQSIQWNTGIDYVVSWSENIIPVDYVDDSNPVQKETFEYMIIGIGNNGSVLNPSLFLSNTIEEPQKSDIDILSTSIQWMFNNGLTKFNDVSSFQPDTNITREQAAKFFATYAQKIANKKINTTSSCIFSDKNTTDPSLRSSVTMACQMNIIKWSSKKFYPKDKLSIPQAIAIAMRITYGNMDESISPWYQNYIHKALEVGIIYSNDLPWDISQTNATRWFVARILYKLSQIK